MRSGVAIKGNPTPILLSPRHASYASTLGKREAPEPLPESAPSPEREQKRFRLDGSGAGEIKLKSGVAAASSSVNIPSRSSLVSPADERRAGIGLSSRLGSGRIVRYVLVK